jgi:hypothetical protein
MSCGDSMEDVEIVRKLTTALQEFGLTKDSFQALGDRAQLAVANEISFSVKSDPSLSILDFKQRAVTFSRIEELARQFLWSQFYDFNSDNRGG